MKAIVIYEPGGSEQLRCTDIPVPACKPGWSLVKVKGFGINRSEIFTRKGYSPSVRFPRVPGIECVGQIAQSERFAQGQTIVSIMGEMGRAYDGSYAEYVLLPDAQIYPVESKLSWADLAAVPETYYTAFGSLKNLRVTVEDSVLVRGASSATGIAFVRLLRARYPHISIAGSTLEPSKTELLLSQGYDEIVLDEQNRLQTERSYNKLLELVGPASLKDSLQHLNEGGIVCSTGQLGHKWYLEEFDPIMELKNNVYLTTFYSGNVPQRAFCQVPFYVYGRFFEI